MPARTPDEIRASIEENRQQLGMSLEKLRVEVQELTDWRSRVARNQREFSLGAAAAGFMLAGGLGGLATLLVGGRKRRSRG